MLLLSPQILPKEKPKTEIFNPFRTDQKWTKIQRVTPFKVSNNALLEVEIPYGQNTDT